MTGAFAEYAIARENDLALKPAILSFEQAAAVPVVAFTALQGLRDAGQIQAGQRVLVNGAAGGVGTPPCSLPNTLGRKSPACAARGNVDLVRSIGADHVVDYTREDFTKTGQRYDLIFDAVGNRSAAAYKRALAPNGRCVVAGFTTMSHMLGQVVFLGSWVSRTSSQKILVMGESKPILVFFRFVNELLDTGIVVRVIDRQYPLSETADAIRYLETGHARGKVVITVDYTS